MFNRFKTALHTQKSYILTKGAWGFGLGATAGIMYDILSGITLKECRMGLYELENAYAFNCTAVGDACSEIMNYARQQITLNCTEAANVEQLAKAAFDATPKSLEEMLHCPIFLLGGGFSVGLLAMILAVVIKMRQSSASNANSRNSFFNNNAKKPDLEPLLELQEQKLSTPNMHEDEKLSSTTTVNSAVVVRVASIN